MNLLKLSALVAFFSLISCGENLETQTETFPTPFEKGNGNTTSTYEEALEFYMQLARKYPDIHIQTLGLTDSGLPLHLVTYNPDGNFNFQRLGEDKVVVLILNGIHPGEPDGIDASMMLMRDLATGKIKLKNNVIPTVIPVYNIGGALNRKSSSRANQNGPESYGFRGNARNYDLNRDFIKMDTDNAASFAEIFHLTHPDFFVDTHVSNGADYQYTLTHLFTQQDKLGGALGKFQDTVLRTAIEGGLKKKNWDITPYVNVFNRSPETGFEQFLDSPRYSTGYAALWNVPGLMIETHMLKPYENRVKATYEILVSILETLEDQHKTLKDLRVEAFQQFLPGNYYPFAWKPDTTKFRMLDFKGFEAATPVSEVTGLPGLKYDQSQPYSRQVPYYDSFKPGDSIQIPKGYWLPKAWASVRERLDINRIKYEVLDKDSTVSVTSYRISNYETYRAPYEGHYPHYNTRVEADTITKIFNQGDLFIPTEQDGIRFILETLEPELTDSFFNWNYFDTMLQRKEGFSPYVFDSIAQNLLKSDSLLLREFRAAKESKPELASKPLAQLDWIYRHSQYYEENHLLYPIYREE